MQYYMRQLQLAKNISSKALQMKFMRDDFLSSCVQHLLYTTQDTKQAKIRIRYSLWRSGFLPGWKIWDVRNQSGTEVAHLGCDTKTEIGCLRGATSLEGFICLAHPRMQAPGVAQSGCVSWVVGVGRGCNSGLVTADLKTNSSSKMNPHSLKKSVQKYTLQDGHP